MLIIHDCRLPEPYIRKIEEKYPHCQMFPFGANCFKTVSKVYKSIKFHPDIFFFQIDPLTLVYSPDLDISSLKPILDRGVTLIEGVKGLGGKYPDTCRYNALKIGEKVFHNTKYTDSSIISAAAEREYEVFDVKQGYAGCSSLVVSGRAVITSDPGIRSAVQKQNIDVLQVSSGDVILPDEIYGFLGGACGVMPDGSIIVSGELKRHKEHIKIEQFINRYKINIFEVKGRNLYDSGSLIII